MGMASFKIADDVVCYDARLFDAIAKILYENSNDIYEITITKKNMQGVELGLLAVCVLAKCTDRYDHYTELYNLHKAANGSLMRWWNFSDCTMVLKRMDAFDESARGAGATEIDKQDVFVKRRGVFAPIVGALAHPVYIDPRAYPPGPAFLDECD